MNVNNIVNRYNICFTSFCYIFDFFFTNKKTRKVIQIFINQNEFMLST